jgi:type I restriction enzyme S subunit
MAVGPFGSRMKADLYVPSGVRVIRGNNLSGGREPEGDYVYVSEKTADSLSSCCLQPGDLVFPHRGNIGQVGITPDDGHRYMLSTSLMKLSPDRQRANPLYLMYFFKSDTGRAALLMNTSQVGTPGIATPLKSLRSIRLPLPPLSVQEEVAATLSRLDDRITLLRETNATLEAIAQALFRSWFVDFDPVRAKQQGIAPAGMDEATAAMFPDRFEESELGMVPKGWRTVTLADLCTFQKGCSYKGDGLSDDQGAYMFNLGCFNAPRVFATEKVKRYLGEFKPKHAVEAGDLIIANTDMTQERAILGRPLFVPSGVTPGFVSHHVFKVGLVAGLADAIKYFLFFAFLQPFFRERAVGYATGTTVLALPKDALEKHQIVLPSDELIDGFAALCAPIFASIETNLQRAESLRDLRETLLPRLICGQLRLPNAEALIQ